MFGEISADLTKVKPEKRAALAELIKAQNRYINLKREFNERKLAYLLNPSAETERQMKEFSEVIETARKEYSKQGGELMKEAIDLDGIRELLPMFAMAVAQKVDWTVLFAASGLDPDAIESFAKAFKEFISEGM